MIPQKHFRPFRQFPGRRREFRIGHHRCRIAVIKGRSRISFLHRFVAYRTHVIFTLNPILFSAAPGQNIDSLIAASACQPHLVKSMALQILRAVLLIFHSGCHSVSVFSAHSALLPYLFLYLLPCALPLFLPAAFQPLFLRLRPGRFLCRRTPASVSAAVPRPLSLPAACSFFRAVIILQTTEFVNLLFRTYNDRTAVPAKRCFCKMLFLQKETRQTFPEVCQ